MPATTDCRSYPYPLDTDLIDVAGDLAKLANAIDDDICAVQQTLRRCGVGVYNNAQTFVPGQAADIIFQGEAYDTDSFHVPNAVNIVIPPGLGGVYACSLSMSSTASLQGGPGLVRMNIGGSTMPRQNTIIIGQQIASVSYTGPLSPGQTVSALFWLAATATANAAIVANLEVLRVSA